MRRLSDQEAHAEAGELAPAPDHPMIAAGEADLIDTEPEYAALLDELRGAAVFGFDTEFIGEHTFYPYVCVVQVATAERVALVDPLAGLDLDAFGRSWRIRGR